MQLGLWAPKDPSGLAAYLVGRNLVGRGFYEDGASLLDAALEGNLPTRRVARETLRQRVVAACALGDQAALTRAKTRIENAQSPFNGAAGGRREATLSMIARCTR